MHKLKKLIILTVLITLALSLGGPLSRASASPLMATSPTLGDAVSFSVLGGETVTNTGPTTVFGDLGVSPGSAATGFPPGIVDPGSIHTADVHAAAAQIANTAAFGSLDQACDVTYTGTQDLTLVSPLVPGVYCADAFELNGPLTLEGSGVWIFKSASTLITSAGSSVSGSDPCNVWWRAGSSATLGVNTSFIGNILALTSVALQTGATLDGKAFAQTGAVTLDSNTITGLTCLPQILPTAVPTATLTGSAPTATSGGPTPTSIGSAPTATSGAPSPTSTGSAPTATQLPVPTALPGTGGAPIRSEGAPWSLLVIIGFSAAVLFFAFRGSRQRNIPKQ